MTADELKTRPEGVEVSESRRVMGGPSSRLREFAVFIIFGAINTLLSYVVYLLALLMVSYPLAYTASSVSGIFISYFLNATFVFKERLRLSRALQYPVVYLVQYLVGIGLLCLFVEVAHLSKFIAPFAVVILTIPVTYQLSRYVIKR